MKPSHLPSPCNVEFHLVVLPFSLHVSVGTPTSNKQVKWSCAVFFQRVGDLYTVKIDVNWADSWYVTCLCNKHTVWSKYAVMRIPSREQSHIPPPLLRALLNRCFSQQNPRKRMTCDGSPWSCRATKSPLILNVPWLNLSRPLYLNQQIFSLAPAGPGPGQPPGSKP